MMQGVAVGWQIYELTNDPFDLGLVGLVQFVPLVALSVVIGQVADRFDRRIVVATCQVGKALAALALALGTATRLAHPRRHAGHPVRVGHRARSKCRVSTRCCPASCR